MWFALLALLIVVPIVEITVIIAVGSQLGVLPTVLLLLASAILGTWLVRREGSRAWRAFRTALGESRPPTSEAVDGVLVFAGGLLMMLPGFVTDLIGLVVVLPIARPFLRRMVMIELAKRLPPGIVGPVPVRARRSRSRRGRRSTVEGELLPPEH
jgi:UPF0716 protein FxsA